ncbi:hypothetical protein KSS87_019062 [Heliosperma pusillum]|nr:hypothetical protein KSS87_019062 [Heliosperma pusillum]
MIDITKYPLKIFYGYFSANLSFNIEFYVPSRI